MVADVCFLRRMSSATGSVVTRSTLHVHRGANWWQEGSGMDDRALFAAHGIAVDQILRTVILIIQPCCL